MPRLYGTGPSRRHGCRPGVPAAIATEQCGVYLGTEVPLPQLASLARDMKARGVAVSVSLATRGTASTTQLRRLRELLPRRLTLLVGGEGAPRPREGIDVVRDLRRFDLWARGILSHSLAARHHP